MSSKNTKWIVFGSVILVLAVLILVGPIMVKKYMRAKWQNAPHYQTSELLMNVSGTLAVSPDNKVYLKGSNGLFYVLEGINQDVSDKIDATCSVVGTFRQAKDGDVIDGNPVRLFIGVQKILFTDSGDTINMSEPIPDRVKVSAEEKSLKKARLRVEANTRLNKPILFDVVKGKVSMVSRKDKDGNNYAALVLKDEVNDNYMLYKKGKDLSDLNGKEVIVLGREILPPSNMLLVTDETTFEIYEVYDFNYNKIM
ncbi:MAG: hypothetical protein II816_06040 [Elusimicrobia bacterium]|nr:hypothetical protein [Elusimicrobiota bacterium]